MAQKTRKTPTVPVTLTLTGDPDHITFIVTDGTTSLAHEQVTYPVIDGRISLPAREAWYDDLVRSGILVLP